MRVQGRALVINIATCVSSSRVDPVSATANARETVGRKRASKLGGRDDQ